MLHLQTQINPPAIVQYISGYQAEIIREECTSIATMDRMRIIMDYITKQIEAIDKARIEMRRENPNFLPQLT